MSEQTTANSLLALSRQLEHLAEAAAHAVVGIRLHGRLVASGLVWEPGVVVTASDALEADDDISVIAAAGKPVSAQFAGRDPTTDVAVLRLSDNLPEPARVTMSDAARVGQIVLAHAARRPDRHSQSRDRSKPGAVTARRKEIGCAGSAIAVELSMDDAKIAERVRMMLITLARHRDRRHGGRTCAAARMAVQIISPSARSDSTAEAPARSASITGPPATDTIPRFAMVMLYLTYPSGGPILDASRR
jgi:Trypsin-like peptidase domain